MKILGIDTSSKFLCIGIYDNSKVYGYNLELGRQLSSLLAVTIKRLLDAAGLGIKDMDYFACGLGPGSFTSLRIGLSTVKGLGWATNKPVIGIPSLDILAYNSKKENCDIIAAIDAKRNLIYSSIYRFKDGRLKRMSPYMLLTKEELFKKIKNNALILGDALDLYRQEFQRNIKGATILDKDNWYPNPHCLIELSLDKIRKRQFSSVATLEPAYLYPKECQVKISVKRKV